jgi:DNA modification methylase
MTSEPITQNTLFYGDNLPILRKHIADESSEELPRRCIEVVGRDGITVLDPFAGSCTTPKVALGYCYIAIGADISREYLEQAAKENGWTTIS